MSIGKDSTTAEAFVGMNTRNQQERDMAKYGIPRVTVRTDWLREKDSGHVYPYSQRLAQMGDVLEPYIPDEHELARLQGRRPAKVGGIVMPDGSFSDQNELSAQQPAIITTPTVPTVPTVPEIPVPA